ncbi:DUF2256 domain-containing protein [Pseudomonas poae]|uniref:DUF2256 domain-containing protein n=1 Tax=Pseudomonas poae TaxID=200451 RepID=UPI0039E1ECB6
MGAAVKKNELPVKTCLTCGLLFTWRKKWVRCWGRFVIARGTAGAPKVEPKRAIKEPFVLTRDYLASQVSTVAAPYSLFHSFKPL